MIVVSDTSPIANLAAIGQLDLLRLLFSEIVIPSSVRDEIDAGDALDWAACEWISTRETTQKPLLTILSLELDAGEAEAILLAMEVKADLLLLDERKARRVAARLGIRLAGLLGVLVMAKQRGLISQVRPLLDALRREAGFWVGEALYRRVLQEAGE